MIYCAGVLIDLTTRLFTSYTPSSRMALWPGLIGALRVIFATTPSCSENSHRAGSKGLCDGRLNWRSPERLAQDRHMLAMIAAHETILLPARWPLTGLITNSYQAASSPAEHVAATKLLAGTRC